MAAALELHPLHDGMTRGKNVTAERAAAKLINSVPPEMPWDAQQQPASISSSSSSSGAAQQQQWSSRQQRSHGMLRWDAIVLPVLLMGMLPGMV
jgi:hypothetical protein